jgi:hypothetical protein
VVTRNSTEKILHPLTPRIGSGSEVASKEDARIGLAFQKIFRRSGCRFGVKKCLAARGGVEGAIEMD